MTQRDKKDGGVRSRKLWYGAATSCMIMGTGVLGAYWPAFGPSVDTVVGGLIAPFAIYCGANWAVKSSLSKGRGSR